MTETDATTAFPDLGGTHYYNVLRTLHAVLRPKTYFEIGTLHGETLALARCASLVVDPDFQFNDLATVGQIMAKPSLTLFQVPSDDFFGANDPTALLGGPVEMAFLDGMHRCEFLLRDFINIERHCRRNSVVILHDCLPVEAGMTARVPGGYQALAPHRQGWWTGDVWRTALLLRRTRQDLHIVALDANPTGLILISNLDPASTAFSDGYDSHVRTMLGWSLPDIGITGLHAEMNVEPTANLATEEQVTARFWL